MSDALYERYKDALRRGHVAAAAGPGCGRPGGLQRGGRPGSGPGAAAGRHRCRPASPGEADRGPGDLRRGPGSRPDGRGRAARPGGARRARPATGSTRPRCYDRLAIALDGRDRLPEAAEAARRALESAESRVRRATMRRYADRLAAAGERAGGDRRAGPGDGRAGCPGDPTTPPPPPPIDPIAAMAELADAVDAGDLEAARSLALAIAAGHRGAARPSAAIDACYHGPGRWRPPTRAST